MTTKGKIVVLISLCAGVADALTGLFLMLAPEFTLGLMGLEPLGYSLVLIRYIGGFVLAVGTAYAFGLVPAWKRGDWQELRTIWKVTAWIRLIVCLFTSAAIASGALESAWISVPLTDGSLALLQGGALLLGLWPYGSKL